MASLHVSTASSQPRVIRKNGELLPATAIQDLKSQLKSEVLVKGDIPEEAYRAAIHRWNEAYITEASIIALCESEEDVATCLHFVQKWGIDLAVAGGRHSYYGASSTTGFVIDLRKMRKVVLSKEKMTISGQGGCVAADLEQPADDEGFSVVFGAVNDTGIAGITLGGGTGPLTGQYGTVSDNLVSAKIVLADGRTLTASEKENSDLFWAIRGCGPNFGVVTEFTYKLHKQGRVFHGFVGYSPDKLEAFLSIINPLFKTVTECAGKLLILTAFAALPGVPGISPVASIFYDGPEAEVRSLAAPLFELGPVMNQASMKRFAEVTEVTPLVTGPPTHQRYTCKNIQVVPPLDVDAIRSLVKDFEAFSAKYGASVGPSKVVIELRSWAFTASVPVSAMAYAGRKPACIIVAEAQYDDASLDGAMRAEIRAMIEKFSAIVAKKNAGKAAEDVVVLNANIGGGDEKVQSLFGENLPRLKELKKVYDPGCIFDKWYPIRLQ